MVQALTKKRILDQFNTDTWMKTWFFDLDPFN